MPSIEREIDWESLGLMPDEEEDRYLDKCTDAGNAIYDAMRETNTSFEDLAFEINKSASYVKSACAGGINLDLMTIAHIEVALDKKIKI